jgi:hypothetical protein
MNSAEKLVGGFLINLVAPFRSLNDMPDAERNRILATLDLNETFEAMCFWFAREMRGTFKMMAIWAELLFFLQRFPRRDLLGCTVSKSLLRQYSVVPISILYEGQITLPHRVFDKYVFLSRGKKGFVQGIVREAWRRAKKIANGLWNAHPTNSSSVRTLV